MALYESDLYHDLCDSAFHDADINEKGFLHVQEFRAAVCNTLRNPDWSRDDWWLSLLLSIHSTAKLSKDECLRLMKCICAIEFENQRDTKQRHVSHDFHIMQLRSSASPEEVIQKINSMEKKWSPNMRDSVPQKKAQEDFLHVRQSARRILMHVGRIRKTSLPLQSARGCGAPLTPM